MSNIDVLQIRQFVDGYRNNKAKAIANKAVKEFLDNYTIWKEIVGYLVDGEDGERLSSVYMERRWLRSQQFFITHLI